MEPVDKVRKSLDKSVKIKGKNPERTVKTPSKDKNPRNTTNDKAPLDPKDGHLKDKEPKKDGDSKAKRSNKTGDKRGNRRTEDTVLTTTDEIEGTQDRSSIVDKTKRRSRNSTGGGQEKLSLQGDHDLKAHLRSDPSIANVKVNHHVTTPGKTPPAVVTSANEREKTTAVTEALEDFWTTAWSICSERFYQGNGSISVSLELRDTWLRIMESQWMDTDPCVGKMIILPPKVFTPDDPPLPLQYDSWSRGALQVFPGHKRKDSILDPFIREEDKIALVKPTPPSPPKDEEPSPETNDSTNPSGNPDDPTRPKQWNPFFFSKMETRKLRSPSKANAMMAVAASVKTIAAKLTAKHKAKTSPPVDNKSKIPRRKQTKKPTGNDEEHLEADDSVSMSERQNEETDTDYYESDYVPTSAEDPVQNLSGRSSSSLSDISKSWEVILEERRMSSKSSLNVNEAYKRLGVKPWSPGDCGARKGRSGVFRLHHETSTEVIRKTNPDYVPKNRMKNKFGKLGIGFSGDGEQLETQPQEQRTSVAEMVINPDEGDLFQSVLDILKVSEKQEFADFRPASVLDLGDKEDLFYPEPSKLDEPRTESMSGFPQRDDLTQSQQEPPPSSPKRLLTKEEQDFVQKKAEAYKAKLQRQQDLSKKLEGSSQVRISDQNPSPQSIPPTPESQNRHQPPDKKGSKSKTNKGHVLMPEGLKDSESSALNFETSKGIDTKKATLRRHSRFVSQRNRVRRRIGEITATDLPDPVSAGPTVMLELSMSDAQEVKVAFK